VLGGSFFIAGYDKQKLIFDKTMTNIMSSLMMAVSFCLIVPTIMSVTSSSDAQKSQLDSDTQILSHAIAITLLIIFVIYLRFRAWFLAVQNDHGATYENHQSGTDSTFSHGLWVTSCILICATACTIACAFYLVGSIDGLANTLDINKTFISLVLLPITGYVAKGVTIIMMARRCEMDFVMKSVVGSILQILLFIIPLLIILGWLLDQPFSLDFNVFEGAVFFLNLIVMTSTVQDGKCNYFDGIMLVGT
jgi:Ca2+:H+ antiporter